MLDARDILDTVQQGQIPRSWHVFHTSKGYYLPRFIVATFGTFFTLLVVCLIFGKTNLPGLALLLVPVIGALTVSALAGLIALRNARKAILVITPQGFMQQTGATKQSLLTVSYRELDNMELEVNVQTRNGYTCRPTVATHGESTRLRIKFRYPDGKALTWSPDKRFGDSTEIAPYINEGYVQHFALRKMRRKVTAK